MKSLITEEEKYLIKQANKYYKMKMEYNEVSRNELKEKYENLEYLMQSILSLVEDGYRYRKEKQNKIQP